MILDYLLTLFDNMGMTFIDILPFTSAPDFFYTTLPEIFQKIMTFNDYLPIYELAGTVLICLTTSFAWKLLKVVASAIPFININLGA